MAEYVKKSDVIKIMEDNSYINCPECFVGCPGDQGEVIRKLQSNE